MLSDRTEPLLQSIYHIGTFKLEDHSSRAWEDQTRLAQPSTMRRNHEKDEVATKNYEPGLFVSWYMQQRSNQTQSEQCRLTSSSEYVHMLYNATELGTRKTVEHCIIITNERLRRLQKKNGTHQAKLPMNATNLSRSAAPVQLMIVQNMTIENLNIFLYHLTRKLDFPLRVNNPFSRMRTAGKSCSGTESRIAREYRNWTYIVTWIRSECNGFQYENAQIAPAGFRSQS
jgi:hypothetical protein